MTGHLARLALRATQPTGGLRPRLPSLFENAPAATPLPDEYAVAHEPPAASGVRREIAPARGPSADVEGLMSTGSQARRASKGTDSAVPTDPATPRVPAAHSARDPVGSRDAPEVTLVVPGDPVPNEGPTRTHEPPLGGEPARAAPAQPHQPGRRGGAVGDEPVPGEETVARLVASLVTEAVTGPMAAEAAAAPDERATALPPGDDATHADAEVPARVTPTSTPLPRLHPATSAGQRRSRPGEPATPDVVVNIGRIEVVQPPPEPRRPPPEKAAPRSKATGAPALADYLRERSGR